MANNTGDSGLTADGLAKAISGIATAGAGAFSSFEQANAAQSLAKVAAANSGKIMIFGGLAVVVVIVLVMRRK